MSERTYEVRIDVTAEELEQLIDIALYGTFEDDVVAMAIAKRIVISNAEQNLSSEREAEIKADLGVEE